jgi:hypothetical protein
MLKLVLTVCSLARGADCHTVQIPLEEGMQMATCVFAAQVEAAKWMTSHPNYYLRRASCVPDSGIANG